MTNAANAMTKFSSYLASLTKPLSACLAFLPARPRGSRRDVQLGAAPPVHPGDEGCAFSGALKVWAFTGRAGHGAGDLSLAWVE